MHQKAGQPLVDFDLILITDEDIIVVELKNWNGSEVNSERGHWFLDGRDQGPNFVVKTSNNSKKLGTELTRQLGSRIVPILKSCVLFHGKVKTINLPEKDLAYIFETQEDFF